MLGQSRGCFGRVLALAIRPYQGNREDVLAEYWRLLLDHIRSFLYSLHANYFERLLNMSSMMSSLRRQLASPELNANNEWGLISKLCCQKRHDTFSNLVEFEQ